ncbi:JAB domain-containing protein [Burkholderiaceae bacterium UC74_6]
MLLSDLPPDARPREKLLALGPGSLAHNHPSGVVKPSPADRYLTERLQAVLALIEVRVADHLVVGTGEPYSFAENGLL